MSLLKKIPDLKNTQLTELQQELYIKLLNTESFWGCTFQYLLDSESDGRAFFEVWAHFPQITLFANLL